MAGWTPFTIGANVSCTDGRCGEVTRLVVDPVARAITHLVVEPKRRQYTGRLVPVDLVDATAGQMRLRCTLADSRSSNPPRRSSSHRASPGTRTTTKTWCSWAYYDLGGGPGIAGGMVSVPQPVTCDSVPLGEVDVRRGEHVHATDGEIGRVLGLVIDRRSHHVTHVLLQEGHLWGRKEVAIPIGTVTGVEHGVRLLVTKEQVQDLPPVDIDHPNC